MRERDGEKYRVRGKEREIYRERGYDKEVKSYRERVIEREG